MTAQDRFSILLPTRNRLDYLRHAVASVLAQDDEHWEIIVSDNDSAEDIRGFVEGLADPRITYVRTTAFLPVTDNWNLALSHAQGAWVVMLGDDDALRPGYLRTLRQAIAAHDQAEVVITSALLFAYPGVMPDAPAGYVQDYGYSTFLRGLEGPKFLDPREAVHLVRRFLAFHTDYGYNMQFFCISRRMIQRLAAYGPFFQSPFPDYYAANAMLLLGAPVLILPQPLVVIGVTPRSFGWYYVNHQEEAGARFLQDLPDPALARELAPVLLPGSHLYTSWLFSAETLCQRLGHLMPLAVDRTRYRRLQITWMQEAAPRGLGVGRDELQALQTRLSRWERLMVLGPLRLRALVRGWMPSPLRRLAQAIRRRIQPQSPAPRRVSGYATMAEVIAAEDPLREP